MPVGRRVVVVGGGLVGVELVSGARVVAIDEESVHYEVSSVEGVAESREAPADTVVLATGLLENPALTPAGRPRVGSAGSWETLRCGP